MSPISSNSDFLVHRLYRIMRQLLRVYNERFLTAGVTAQQFFVLYHLLEHKTQNASTCASTCGLDPATLTGLLNSLEKKRLIKRTINKSDRRTIQVALTTSGLILTRRLLALAVEFHQLLQTKTTVMSEIHFHQFLEALEKFLERDTIKK